MKRSVAVYTMAMFAFVAWAAPRANAHCGQCGVTAEEKAEKPACQAKVAKTCSADAKACTRDAKACSADSKSCSAGSKACAPDAKACCAEWAIGVGDKAMDFTAVDPRTGNELALSKLAGKNLTALIFWNQNCPFVVDAKPRIQEFQKKYADRGVQVVAIDAGVNNKPEEVAKHGKDLGFPLLVNRDSKVAAHYGATKTPEVFLLDKDMTVRYHGAFDSGRPGNSDEITHYVAEAAKELLKGEKLAKPKTKAFGCSLKYAEGVKPLPAAKPKEATTMAPRRPGASSAES